MTDDELQGTPIDHKYGLACELGVIDWLLERNAVTKEGMQALWWKLRIPGDVMLATGALYEYRENVTTTLVDQLAAATGMPTSYWTDRPLIDTPDNAGDISAE